VGSIGLSRGEWTSLAVRFWLPALVVGAVAVILAGESGFDVAVAIVLVAAFFVAMRWDWGDARRDRILWRVKTLGMAAAMILGALTGAAATGHLG
jgi:Flp pilus assembly protein TadB